MPNFATALKDEVRRLARKEIRAEARLIRRAVAQHRHEIARLKRVIQGLEKQVRRLAQKEPPPGRADTGMASRQTPANRFSARSVRAQRRRLKLSAAQFGQLVGVSGQTIYQWEQGKSRPRKSQFQALIELRGIGRRDALNRLGDDAEVE